MAKQSAKQVAATQREIPEAWRGRMRRSDDGETLFYTIPVPVRWKETVRKTDSIEILFDEVSPDHVRDVFFYGLGRTIRDGAKTSETVKGSDGKARERKFSEAEKREAAILNAELKRDWLYGKRDKQARASAVPPVVREAIRLLSTALVAKGAFDKKALPEGITGAKSLEDIRSAALALGVAKNSVEKLIGRAEEIAAPIDLEITL